MKYLFSLTNYTLYYIAILVFTACSNSGNSNSDDLKIVDLSDGFYYLNGTDANYKVRRDIKMGGNYILNPEPIFQANNYSSIDVIKEENNYYSLSFNFDLSGQQEWEKALKSDVHYIGFVSNKRLKHLLKIKGDNSRNDVYLNCVSNSEEEANLLKKELLKK